MRNDPINALDPTGKGVWDNFLAWLGVGNKEDSAKSHEQDVEKGAEDEKNGTKANDQKARVIYAETDTLQPMKNDNGKVDSDSVKALAKARRVIVQVAENRNYEGVATDVEPNAEKSKDWQEFKRIAEDPLDEGVHSDVYFFMISSNSEGTNTHSSVKRDVKPDKSYGPFVQPKSTVGKADVSPGKVYIHFWRKGDEQR